MRPAAAGPGRPHVGSRDKEIARVPDPVPGRALVTRHALEDVVRAATLGSYGVSGLSGGIVERALSAIGIGQPGIRIAVSDGVRVELDLMVAHGLPVAEVARQVDSAVRYAVRRATGRELERLTIHVDGLAWQPGVRVDPTSPGPSSPAPIERRRRARARRDPTGS
jgi:uncharacterized alkaline shock family protein YloU